MKNRKEVLTGFLVGIIANTLGTVLYILIFTDLFLMDALKAAYNNGHLGSVIALGAILNLVAFFGFIKLKRDQRAKGVLIATLLAAILIMIYKIFG